LLTITSVFAADPDCSSVEYRRLDFWIGEWNVTYRDGKPAGKSLIQKVLKDCVILENWTGVDGFDGKSFNLYDRNKNKWIQKWVDSRGQLLEFEGIFMDKTLEYLGKYKTLDGKNVVASMSFSHESDGTVRQIWKQSIDSGKTWKVEFDGVYTKVVKD
jgi:hypothetical protein